MTYATIRQVGHKIHRTHCLFAGKDVNEVYGILEAFERDIYKIPAMIGATFEAHTLVEFGSLDTFITINRLQDGRWDMTETIRYPENI